MYYRSNESESVLSGDRSGNVWSPEDLCRPHVGEVTIVCCRGQLNEARQRAQEKYNVRFDANPRLHSL